MTKKEANREWIYIGEIEMPDEDHYTMSPNGFGYTKISCDNNFLCGPKTKHFLYKGFLGNGFMYCISASREKRYVSGANPVFISKDYSIFTILTMIISADLCNFRGNVIGKSTKKRIRLVGMDNWIESNEDYLNLKINEEDLEKLFESKRNE